MTKYRHWLFATLLGTIVLLTVLLYHKTQVLNSRINTINKELYGKLQTDNLNSSRTFKEDYYITQQSLNTTLILTCFGVGFALFSFFTYRSVIGLMSDEVKQIKDNYITHENNYKIQHGKLIKIEKDLLLQMGYTYKERAILYHSKNEIDNCIKSSIIACEQFCKLLDILTDKEKTYSDSIKIHLHELIKGISTVTLNSEGEIIYKDYDEHHFKRRTETILKHLKGEAYFAFYTSLQKIKFEKYEFPFIV